MKTVDVCAETGATYRQLMFWLRRGYIKDSAADVALGSGYPLDWEPAEVAVIGRMVELVKAGIRPEVAAKAAHAGDEAWLSPRVKVSVTS